MKTPREILFERHRLAESKLDAVRHRAIVVAARPACAEASLGTWLRAALKTAWQGLIWPSRRTWAAIAMLWLAVLVGNLELKTPVQSVAAGKSEPVPKLAQELKEQRRLLTELLETTRPPSSGPAPQAPQPRSELRLPFGPC